MAKARRPARRSASRGGSERALVQAFEAMLRRHGPSGVGVNLVLGSAGVGKRLLYKYFGDLRGLAEAWARNRRDPLALGRRGPALLESVRRLPPRQRVDAIVEDYATSLRRHPWALQVLLAELVQPSALGNALHEMRTEIGRGHERLLLDSKALEAPHALERALVQQAAATYLALRARFAPDYNGIDLASEAGWRTAMQILRGRDRGGTPRGAPSGAAARARTVVRRPARRGHASPVP
jgi:AcrR family transcriptional regulator